MLISIATVCFNSAKTIRTTLDSVRAQTYRPLELVIVDGGSTDQTMDIVAEYADIHGTVVSEPDAGIYDAMNKAIRLAKGDVIFFLNSDDCFSDNQVIQDVVNVFSASNSDLVFGDVFCINGSTRFRKDQSRITRKNILFEGICHQSVFARTDFVRKMGSFDLDYKICADYDWMIRAFTNGGKTSHIPRVIADYSMEGFSEKNLKLRLSEQRMIQEKHYHPLVLPIAHLSYRIARRLAPIRKPLAHTNRQG